MSKYQTIILHIRHRETGEVKAVQATVPAFMTVDEDGLWAVVGTYIMEPKDLPSDCKFETMEDKK